MEFFKMAGSGNDFVVIDNRGNTISNRKKAAVLLCNRKFGIGADGLLLLEKSRSADIRMRIFNPDGSEAEMCGNGLRCIMLFAVRQGIVKGSRINVETGAGLLEGSVSGRKVRAQLKLAGKPQKEIKIPAGGKTITACFINTGVPHTVIFTDDIEKVDVNGEGPAIRYHRLFKPKGTNVDWIEITGNNTIKIRTYERGVEGETLSCGTGSVAGAIAGFLAGRVSPPVKVIARSGEKLTVSFDRELKKVYLEGDILTIFRGEWLGR
ncbi:MAG TPA: diaminopimelate epimerase [bacterium]|nr:diaminopimelate epimerase [bacterium]HPP30567.1 diaminopimelate epimerase [bacterium]